MFKAKCFTLFKYHKSFIYAFQQHTDKCSLRQTRQLDFISQFTTNIHHIKGSENVTADTLSQIAATTMPNSINYEEISKVQVLNEPKLRNLINNPQSLQLKKKKVTLSGQINQIHCDFLKGTALHTSFIFYFYRPRETNWTTKLSLQCIGVPLGPLY